MGNEIQQSYTLNGRCLEKLDEKLLGHDIYVPPDEVGGQSTLTFYLVKGVKVVEVLTVDADCNQNTGFISNWDITKIKESL